MRDKSIWLLEEGDKYPRLKGDIVVDVAIAGGGIAGLTAAYMLKKAGLKVAVVEANKIAEGVSGHTTGKITSQHDLIYNKLSRKFDIDTAKLYARANQDAIERIEQIINQEKIECNFLSQDAYIYTCIKNKKKDIEQEAKAALNMGIKSELTKETGLPFEVELALRFKNQAMFH
ncbi:MAG TPA: FAD-binding oxidoreductase, partial [Clostridia bacterium]|nr:FAD-binding oxidoreductase [Clostridia bacterium]